MKDEHLNEKHDKNLLTKEAVANWLQVSTRKVDGMMAEGSLPFLKLGNRTVRFQRQEVAEALARLNTKVVL